MKIEFLSDTQIFVLHSKSLALRKQKHTPLNNFKDANGKSQRTHANPNASSSQITYARILVISENYRIDICS